MTGRGRPSAGVRVDIRIPTEVLSYLDMFAKVEGTTRATLIRRILTEWAIPPD